MVKSFKEFLNEAIVSDNISEEPVENVEYLGKDEDFEKPEFLSDSKYFTKITGIVLKKLKKNFNVSWEVHPYILSVDGKKCTMLNTENIYLILTKMGIEKRIIFFKSNPLENEAKSEFSITTQKKGFLAMINTLIDVLKVAIDNNYINEAKEITPRKELEITPAGKMSSTGSAKKIITSLSSVQEDEVNEFLKLFEQYDDADITRIMTNELFDELNPMYKVQRAIYLTSSGEPNAVNGTKQVTNMIHMILCGSVYGMKPDAAEAMKKAWFWNGGKSGKLATYIDERDGLWKVKESESVINEEIDTLDSTMNRVSELTEVILNYVMKSGKGGTADALLGRFGEKRGLFITGTGGIGKSRGIRKAIEDTGAKENIDYVKLTTAATPQSIYKDMYRYNNMLIIYDDTDEYFNDEEKIKLYKLAVSALESERTINAPGARGAAGEENGTFYDVAGERLSRRDRYYKEVGTISNYDKKKFIENAFNKYKREEISMSKSDESYTMTPDSELRRKAINAFTDYENDHRKKMYPNKFTFNGFFIFITNKPVETYKKLRYMAPHWGAISGRMRVLDISPRQKVLWEWIKGKIYADAENPDLEDEMRILPLHSKAEGGDLKNVMKFIEDTMNGENDTDTTHYGKIEFRTITNLKHYLSYEDNTEKEWKDLLLSDMVLATEREVS